MLGLCFASFCSLWNGYGYVSLYLVSGLILMGCGLFWVPETKSMDSEYTVCSSFSFLIFRYIHCVFALLHYHIFYYRFLIACCLLIFVVLVSLSVYNMYLNYVLTVYIMY